MIVENTMIEIKAITVEKDCYYEGNNINIELSAPFDLNVHKFHRQFQQLIAMENQKLNNRRLIRDRAFECSVTMSGPNLYNILKIYHNAEKSTTVVCFDLGIHEIFSIGTEESKSKIKVKRDSEDHDDIYMAVASAVMIRKYKSNSQFKAHIRRSMPKEFEGYPGVYRMMAAAEVSEIYGSWEKFCKIVDEKLEVYHG